MKREGLVLRRTALALCLAFALFSLSACGGPKLTADSKCIDYIKSDGQSRYDAAIRITTELQVQDAGNPMWELNLDASCGQQPTRTIREVLGKGGASASNNQSFNNSNSPSSSNTQLSVSSSPSPASSLGNPSGQIGTSASGKDARNGTTGGIG